MDSAFYTCVDDTIEDAFDASSDTEPADSDASVTPLLPSHTRLNSEPKHRDTMKEDRASFGVRNCHTVTDWSTDSQREHLSKDTVLQGNSAGNSDSQRLPTTGSLRHHQSLADDKRSLTVSDNIPLDSDLPATDVYHSELSRQRTLHCRDNMYANKSDASCSRQSLLKSMSRTESSRSHFPATLPSVTNRVASAMYLPDDKVMEIVEEQLENDDDDDDDDANSVEDIEDEEENCMVNVKPASVPADDEGDIDSDIDESEVDEVEEISEDDEDRLADEERAVLEEAARAAAEAAASSTTSFPSSSSSVAAGGQTTDYPTNVTSDDTGKKTCLQSAVDVPSELPLSAELCNVLLTFLC